MLVVELIIVLLAIFLGARLGGIGIGFAALLQIVGGDKLIIPFC